MSPLTRAVVARAVLATTCLFLLVGTPVFATDADDAAEIADGLQKLAGVLDNLGGFDVLGNVLPLLPVAPGSPQALDLGSIFSQSLGTLSPALADLDALRDAIDNADFTTVGGVSIAFDNVTVTRQGNRIAVAFDTSVTRPGLSLPLDVSVVSGPVDAQLGGGAIPVDLRLDLPLSFELDTTITDPDLRFYISYSGTPPAVLLPVTASAGTSFDTNLGFTQISVAPNVSLDLDFKVQLNDPDSDNRITREEWEMTALDDLFSASIECDGTPDIDASLELTSTSNLIPGQSTITFSDTCIADGIDLPSFDWNDIRDFSTISPTTVLQGLSVLASAVRSSQVVGDIPIPFIREGLADVFTFAQPIVDFIDRLGTAAIACGPIAADPPRGNLQTVVPGDLVYCQAIAVDTPTANSVSWVVRGNGGAPTACSSPDPILDTVGPNPTANVVCVAQEPGVPKVEVSYTDSAGPHTVQRRFLSAQEMALQLLDLGGFENVGDLVSYDSANRALIFHLQKIFSPAQVSTPAPGQDAFTLDFSDQLKADTGVAGLGATAAASVQIDPGMVTLDINFGVLLGELAAEFDPDFEEPDPTSPDPSTPDRFFVQSAGAPLLSLNNVQADVDVDLQGMIGFLQVQAVDDASGFQLGTAGPGPLLTVDVNYGDEPGLGRPSPVGGLTDAIRFRELLRQLGRIEPGFNLAMNGGLEVVATAGTAELGRGSVGLSWVIDDPENIGRPTIMASAELSEQLTSFDIDPSIRGEHQGTADSAALQVTDANTFLAERLVNSTLRNLTDGSQCVVRLADVNTNGDRIACQLAGGTDNDWDAGDRFEVGGNPLALLAVILDNLETVLAAFDQTDALDEELPLIGRSPRQLLSQLQEIRQQLQDFRSQQALAQVVCTLPNADGDPAVPRIALVDLPANQDFFCQARSATVRPEMVQWSAEGAAILQSSNDTDVTTVAALGESTDQWVRFRTVRNGANPGLETDATQPTDFRISVDLKESGMQHPVHLPITPLTLQNLSELLACRLGIPEDVLTLSVEDLPLPAGASGPNPGRDLVVGLRFGLCTQNPGEDGILGSDDDLPNDEESLACMGGDRLIEEPATTLRLDLPPEFEGSELVGLDASDPQLMVEARAAAVLDIGIPLALDFNPDGVVVRDTSRLEIGAAASIDDLLIEGNVGPLRLTLGGSAEGDGAAQLGLMAKAATATMGDTYSPSGFLSALEPSYGGLETERDCGTAELRGTHTGSAAAALLTDSTQRFDDSLQGLVLSNLTDGSSCTIASFTNTTLTCTLDGGTDNAWDPGDEYRVAEVPLVGDVCAGLRLELEPFGELGRLGFRIEELESNIPRMAGDGLDDVPGWFLSFPPDLLEQRLNASLNLTLVLEALPVLLDNLAAGLQAADSLPLIGRGLGNIGGAIDEINMRFVTPLANAITEVLAAKVTDVESEIRDKIWAALPAEGQNLVIGGKDGIEVSGDVCSGSTPCDDDAEIDTLQDLRIRIVLGKGGEPNPDAENPIDPAQAETDLDLPLDFGVPGLPISASGQLAARFGWRLPIEIGLSRDKGPYIVTSPSDECPETTTDSGTSFRIGANVGLGDDPLSCGPGIESPPAGLDGFSTDRCFMARLGFLDTYINDDENDPSGVTAFAFTHLKSDNGDPKVPLTRLIGGTSFEAGLITDARLAFRFRTGVAGSAAEVLPSVVGTVELEAGWQFPAPDPEDENATPNGLRLARFDNLHLDLSNFFGEFIGPAVSEVKRVTSPLKPVIDTVRAPLPVVSELSQATGGGPITVLSLVELRNCPPPGPNAPCTKLIRNILDVIDFVNNLPVDQGTVLIPLGNPGLLSSGGSFELDVAAIREGGSLPSDADELIDFNTANSTRVTFSGTERVPATFSFPFLDDSSQIFGLLLGQDVVLVRFDAGILRGTAGFQYTYGPFFVGPIPVEVSIGGSATLQARFAMGYDTSGIRQVLDGGSGSALIDGIFIDDLDTNGNDVPEISLIGQVSAGAGVSLGIVAAGIEGGVRMTTDLNLDDRPDPDGKLRISEIANKLHNPACLFVISGKLEAFLAGWVRVGIEWFSKKWSITFVRVTLLEFEIKCDPPPPVLAEVEPNRLILLVGSEARRKRRGVQPDRIDEKVVVRQLGNRTFEVSGFGITQVFNGDDPNFQPAEARIPGSGPVTVVAFADDGKDNLSMETGIRRNLGPDGLAATGDEFDEDIPFTARCEIHGGPGNDQIKTGLGIDLIFGDEGSDRIQGGPSDDTIHGGPGDDTLAGEGGDDTIFGDTGNDVITGGPGMDTLDGGPDNDDLNGGWLATRGVGDAAIPAHHEDPTLDLADTISGGAGDDDIEGEFGDDFLYGDFVADGSANLAEVAGCSDGEAGGGADHVNGGPGEDHIWGGQGNDALGGDLDDDFLCGGGGDDLIDGDDPDLALAFHGHDQLWGGSGHDGLWGRGGNDRLYGQADNDELFAGPGFDDLIGGAGRDLLFGEEDNDVLIGDSGELVAEARTGPSPPNRGTAPADGDPGLAPLDDGFLLSRVSRPADVAATGLIEDCFAEGGEDTIPRVGGAAGNADCLIGGPGHDLLFGESGNDGLYGDRGDDFLEGGAGSDSMRGGRGDDVLYGHRRDDAITDWRLPPTTVSTTAELDADSIFGDSGEDLLFGGPDDDSMRGGSEDDYLEGNQAADALFGDGGQDDLIGGSSVAHTSDDGTDQLFGNADADILVGDNATVERTGEINAVDGSAVRRVALLDLDTQGGPDEMHGNQANDYLWGGRGDDLMHGDDGDDVLAGNGGGDEMFGDAGQDDLVGGTGRTVTETGRTVIADRSTAEDGRADGDDILHGGTGDEDLDGDFDVIAGDNAIIDRPLDENGQWILNTFNDGVRRDVWLFDVADLDNPADALSAGADTIFGEAADDLIWGQGDDDEIHGGTGADIAMGMAGADLLFGDEDDDDLTGGTGRINDDPAEGVEGRLDAGDVMHGGSGFDVMAGDNALITRTLVGGAWVLNTYDGSTKREPRILLDIDHPRTADVAGPDEMNGNGANDLLFGQGDRDLIHGNDGDDFMEGNADVDDLFGDAGQDDMIGGTVQAGVTDDGADDIVVEGTARPDTGDLMEGGGEGDVMIGDNGSIGRPLDGEGLWRIDPNTGDVIRSVTLFDVEITGAPVSATLSGGDRMLGQDGHDRLFGQGGDDRMEGGDAFDVLEGNHGSDLMFGDAGEDDMIGGGSANDGVIRATSVGDGLTDGDDFLFGGLEGDVMAGDNARITRPVDDDGLWSIDPNSDDVVRSVALFDVERIGEPQIAFDTSGSDQIFGQEGRDLMFGQGNADAVDEDADGFFSEDPQDGVDNDHDGRESLASLGYDCEDGIDNDGDLLADLDDPDCLLAIDEDGGGDLIVGGPGVDYLEGNHGGDWMFGDEDEDDMIGGSSAGDGVIGGGVPPAGLADGNDVMIGGPEDDLLVADNAIVERPEDEAGFWQRLTGFGFDLAVRVTTMAEVPEPEGAFGNDFALGQDGADELYGQQGDDYLEGNFGEDALVGDLGQVTSVIEDGSRTRHIASNSPFLFEDVFVEGTLSRITELFSFEDGQGAEGHDVLLGGDGDDHLHGGPGDDLINGDGDGVPTEICETPFEDPVELTADRDYVFGGDGNDALWGGRGRDHVWGGHGDDYLDVKPREERPGPKKNSPVEPADPPEWFTWGVPDSFEGLDILYGGWDADALQADEGGAGPTEGDRLIDWAGGYNIFYVCPAEFGEGYITRIPSPDVLAFLQDLAEGDGAVDPRDETSSGFHELAFVFNNEIRFNSHPPHPDHPGHFTCTCEEEESAGLTDGEPTDEEPPLTEPTDPGGGNPGGGKKGR